MCNQAKLPRHETQRVGWRRIKSHNGCGDKNLKDTKWIKLLDTNGKVVESF
jgi:hypothetical protein